MSELKPVIIIGAGPVGMAAALFLVEQGVPVRVLEAASELSQDMRASTFHPPTLDMLAPSGLAHDLIGQGHKAAQWQYRQHESGERIIFDLGVLEGLTEHPFRLQCEQFRLTRAILDRLDGRGDFEMIFDAEVTAVTQDEGGVTVTATVDGGAVRFAGSHVVAADGGRSTVRKLMGLAFNGETYPRTSITVVVDHPFEQRMEGILHVNYLWTADDHFSLMRVRDHWRVGFSPRPGQHLDEATSAEGVERRLQDILPAGEPYRLLHVGAYSVHRRVIDDFRHGRILFAGDAAHLNSPAGGMGMNSGVHDAHNLALKLAAVIKGGDDALLDRYARQRRTIAVEDVQARSDNNYKRHREKDPVLRRQIWDDLARTAGTRDTMREFLRGSSMLDSLALAETIT